MEASNQSLVLATDLVFRRYAPSIQQWVSLLASGARRRLGTSRMTLLRYLQLPWLRSPDSAAPTLISPQYIQFQRMPHAVLSRYVSIQGKHVLEIGGAQACIAAQAFLDDGAARVTVTGLDHLSEEGESSDGRLIVIKADALELRRHFSQDSFDLVFGLSIIEHIPSPQRFLEEVYHVLKPGGIALFEGYPLWSSPHGHHLWVTAKGGRYGGISSANYLFAGLPSLASSNPIPDWAHLLMEPSELERCLEQRSLPSDDIACIVDWVYHSDEINRLTAAEIIRTYSESPFLILEAIARRDNVAPTLLRQLRAKYGEGCDFGVSGLTYILAKPH